MHYHQKCLAMYKPTIEIVWAFIFYHYIQEKECPASKNKKSSKL